MYIFKKGQVQTNKAAFLIAWKCYCRFRRLLIHTSYVNDAIIEIVSKVCILEIYKTTIQYLQTIDVIKKTKIKSQNNLYYKIIAKIKYSPKDYSQFCRASSHKINRLLFCNEKLLIMFLSHMRFSTTSTPLQQRKDVSWQWDMSKAYDMIEWKFICMVMERLGFQPSTMYENWIIQCTYI